jgi:16S rRNA (guanine(966)-N(2))-methyltransferase RsmD
VKQTLFAILEPDLEDAAVLDLYAGSGAAGIEALSRGAGRATFVERDPGAIATIRDNLRRCGFDGPAARVVRSDVRAWLEGTGAAEGPFDVVLVDPPYGEPESLLASLETLGRLGSGLLSPGARVVAKHFWRDRPPDRVGLLGIERDRRFGETALTFYRAVGEGQ